jgi:ABC-type lipopolysaccharide export system ATPase subunit
MIGRIGEVIREIHRQGTSVLLVEQNATMALAVATSAFVMDIGRVSLQGPAAELAQSDAVQRLYLGHGDDDAAPELGKLPTAGRRPTGAGRTLSRWTA